MIIETHQLPQLHGKTAMVAGGFDPVHEGHIAYFKAAAGFGFPVLCCIDGDEYISRKHRLLLTHRQRAAVIDALAPIAYTYLNTEKTVEALRLIRPRLFVKGNDWGGRLPPDELSVCRKLGIEVVFVDTKLNSSSALIRRFHPPEEETLNAFEQLVLTQTMPAAAAYDQEYFQGPWRTVDRYDLESRREIEGRHPDVIKEVFSPQRVMDMGCGPGYLMHLLNEIGVYAEGLDISPSSLAMATDEIRPRIRISSIVDVKIPSCSYDLVICREVLEHLPVIDVNLAVQNMCRISSHFVYVTTRFHPAPTTLLDVTNQHDVDPTHITLMNKNLLCLMFVLNGFRRREDLEVRMDWLKKGRVLVYERAIAVKQRTD
ncbi:MAG: methyltransferase domain-containing protein [Deltaproteobacteria bacterium]|nr:methyltransferase domain-containing protein [Deltaproteobacteria bacterium]